MDLIVYYVFDYLYLVTVNLFLSLLNFLKNSFIRFIVFIVIFSSFKNVYLKGIFLKDRIIFFNNYNKLLFSANILFMIYLIN
jgi:hypothetical protein